MVSQLVESEDPLALVRSWETPANCRHPGDRVRLDNVKEDPYGKGWFYSLKGVDQSSLDELMDAEQYEKLISGQAD